VFDDYWWLMFIIVADDSLLVFDVICARCLLLVLLFVRVNIAEICYDGFGDDNMVMILVMMVIVMTLLQVGFECSMMIG